jgi:anti-sigma28 factor (negative regulator of flagellin synthesis)
MKLDEMHTMNIGQSNLLRMSKGGGLPSKQAAHNDQPEPIENDLMLAGMQRGLLSLDLATSTPDTSSQRVAELRAQVQSGRYQMDLPEVSRAIVDSAFNSD